MGFQRRTLEVHESPGYFILNHLTAEMRGYLVADHLADDVYTDAATVEYPRSTWQMFKHTHADSWWLRWLVRRRPVEMDAQTRMLRVEVGRYLAYPEAVVQVPKFGRPVIHEVVQVDRRRGEARR
jgi:hypothetical protein